MVDEVVTTEVKTEPAATAAASTTAATTDAKVDAPKSEASTATAETDAAAKTETAVAPTWRDDWRKALAGGDEKAEARLNRFQSPENVFKSWAELDKKISAGALKSTLPENATPEDIAAYRKSWDVPEKPEGYEIAVPAGLELLDPEKESLNLFLKDMHDSNAPKAMVKKATESYFKVRELELQQIYEAAQEKTINSRATMKAEWGRDYDRNSKLVNNDMVATIGAEAAQRIAGRTFIDGTKVGDDPDFLRYVAAKALASADDGMLVMSDSAMAGKSVEEAYRAAIDLKFTDPTKYHSDAHQKHLQQLAAAKAQRPKAA